jgi:hypothetical protein
VTAAAAVAAAAAAAVHAASRLPGYVRLLFKSHVTVWL